jgi:hypothetical protein
VASRLAGLRRPLKGAIHLPFNALGPAPVQRGKTLRWTILGAAGLASIAGAMPASAATIVIFTNPMTLERRTVVIDPDGPDRAFLCTLPPGEAGCQPIKVRRAH